jgi:hypothetical protein
MIIRDCCLNGYNKDKPKEFDSLATFDRILNVASMNN